MKLANRIENGANIFNAQYGEFGGRTYLFTHRNPKTGDVWSDDIASTRISASGEAYKVYGRWVDSRKVSFT